MGEKVSLVQTFRTSQLFKNGGKKLFF